MVFFEVSIKIMQKFTLKLIEMSNFDQKIEKAKK